MDDHGQHDAVIRDLERELAEVLDGSEQGVYVYLDDEHKFCNGRFATLLGYESPGAWASVREPFPMVFVAPQSHHALISAYQAAMEAYVASSRDVTWLRRDGGTVHTTVTLVPIAYGGHLFALHFVDPR